MFKDQFYRITNHKQEEDTEVFSIEIEKSHAIFNGHFPGNPVTPGVVQMEIIKELVGEVIGVKMNMVSMSNCKFLAILNPEGDAAVDVQLKLSQGDAGEWKVNATIINSANTYLKMSAIYLPN